MKRIGFLILTCLLFGAAKVENEPENLAIIGGGPAGCTAALYAGRSGFAPTLYTGYNPGGQLATTGDVENFPGFPEGITGSELATRFETQASRFGAKILRREVAKITIEEGWIFAIQDSEGETHYFKAVILATGAAPKLLEGVEGHREFWQKGVSACALCDGALPIYRNKPVVVVGGGDSAMEEALHLAKFASKVIIIHRGEHFRATPVMQERVLSHPKIEVIWKSEVVKLSGDDGFLAHITIKENGKERTLEAKGLFYAIGHTPRTELIADKLGIQKGSTLPTKGTRTDIPGLFAAGDCMDGRYQQVITAAAFGSMAAIDVEDYLETNQAHK